MECIKLKKQGMWSVCIIYSANDKMSYYSREITSSFIPKAYTHFLNFV